MALSENSPRLPGVESRGSCEGESLCRLIRAHTVALQPRQLANRWQWEGLQAGTACGIFGDEEFREGGEMGLGAGRGRTSKL